MGERSLIDKLTYIASAYSIGDKNQNYLTACQVCAYLLNMGFTVYSPIAHWHPIAMMYDLPKAFSFWQKHDLLILSRCDKMIILTSDGWKDSIGIKAELAFCERHNIRVEYFDPQEL